MTIYYVSKFSYFSMNHGIGAAWGAACEQWFHGAGSKIYIKPWYGLVRASLNFLWAFLNLIKLLSSTLKCRSARVRQHIHLIQTECTHQPKRVASEEQVGAGSLAGLMSTLCPSAARPSALWRAVHTYQRDFPSPTWRKSQSKHRHRRKWTSATQLHGIWYVTTRAKYNVNPGQLFTTIYLRDTLS